jgi:hypothetical protein
VKTTVDGLNHTLSTTAADAVVAGQVSDETLHLHVLPFTFLSLSRSKRHITATDVSSEQSTTSKIDLYLTVSGVIHLHYSDAKRNGSVIFLLKEVGNSSQT